MDALLQLAHQPVAQRLWKSLRLPGRLPHPLRRDAGVWRADFLAGRHAVLVSPCGAVGEAVAQALLEGGAVVNLVAQRAHGAGPGATVAVTAEATGRAALLGSQGDAATWKTTSVTGGALRPLGGDGASVESLRPDMIVLDLTHARQVEDLALLYDAFHPWLRRLQGNGRAVVLARQPGPADAPEQHAVARAVTGFARSLAKEIGRFASTAHALLVPDGMQQAAAQILRFVVSDHASFLTGQCWQLSPLCAAPAPARGAVDVGLVQGKVALVTGAARGIGLAIAAALRREGAIVVALDLPGDEFELRRVASELGVEPLMQDLAERDAGARVREVIESRHHHLDIVVHNAGITRDRALANSERGPWLQAVDVNLGALIRLQQALSDLMSDDGRVVAMSSVAGLAGNMGQTNYAASKAGVLGYVEALARELAGRRIAVTAIAPGFIETRLTQAVPFAIRETARRLSALNQGGQPQDVAELAVFLASPSACALSGGYVRACGGMLFGA